MSAMENGVSSLYRWSSREPPASRRITMPNASLGVRVRVRVRIRVRVRVRVILTHLVTIVAAVGVGGE